MLTQPCISSTDMVYVHSYSYTSYGRNIVNDKSYAGEKFMVFVDFQQTAKVVPTNFINLYKAKHV